MSNSRTPKATRPDPPADARTERGERAARPRSKRSGRVRLDPARTEWQPATYEERGSHLTVRLKGRTTTVHPLWHERFQPLTWEDLKAVTPALWRLKDWLLEVLVERPVGIVIERVGDGEVARVVREVDLFDLVVLLRVQAIPVHELPGTADVERLILLDGFVEPVVRALVTRPDRVIASIAKAEKVGKPLIVPKERGSGQPASALTREDLSRLLGRDAKTLRKIESHLQQPGKAGGSRRSTPGPGGPTPVASAHGRAPRAVPPGPKGASRSSAGGEVKSVSAERTPREAAMEGLLHTGDLSVISSRVPDPRDGGGMDRGSRVGLRQRRKRATQGQAKEPAGMQRLSRQLELNLISANTAQPGERPGAGEAP